MILKMNSDYFSKEHCLAEVCNGHVRTNGKYYSDEFQASKG
jgi:hypothetical protein